MFIDERLQKKTEDGILLKWVEDEERAMEAGLSKLIRFDFQAQDFYIQQGYEIFGVLDDTPKQHSLYFLKKTLW